MGRSAILGEQRNNYFCDVACGRGEMGDSTYAITKSGLLCEFNNRRLLDKWVELRVSIWLFNVVHVRVLSNVCIMKLVVKVTNIRVIKSRRLRLAGHVARMGRGEVCTRFWCGNSREGDHLEDRSIVGKKILKWIL